MKHIYLDYNASTPIAPQVREAMLPFLAEHYGNPSSAPLGGRAGGRGRGARPRPARRAARLLAGEVVFTSGGSEANNTALKGVVEAAGGERRTSSRARSSTPRSSSRAGTSSGTAST